MGQPAWQRAHARDFSLEEQALAREGDPTVPTPLVPGGLPDEDQAGIAIEVVNESSEFGVGPVPFLVIGATVNPGIEESRPAGGQGGHEFFR